MAVDEPKALLIQALTVVVPVKNESANVHGLIAEIDQTLGGLIPYEIIYIDDGSTDDTLQQLVNIQQNLPQLRIIRHRYSCGQSTAVRTGVKAARYQWVATLDGDGQNDPADIPRLLQAVTAGVELVGGNRRQSRQDTWVKRLSSVVANTVRAKMLRDETPDTGCGLKLFNRDAFLDLPYFDHMHRFLPALIKRRGGKIVSVPVKHRQRAHGQSNYGTWDRLRVGVVDLMGVAWLQRRAKLPEVVED